LLQFFSVSIYYQTWKHSVDTAERVFEIITHKSFLGNPNDPNALKDSSWSQDWHGFSVGHVRKFGMCGYFGDFDTDNLLTFTANYLRIHKIMLHNPAQFVEFKNSDNLS
jgi:hypothetical protein